LQTVFAADKYLAEGQINARNSSNHRNISRFPTGKRMPTVSSKEGQNSKPELTLRRKGESKWFLPLHKAWKFGLSEALT
jgi:hypothetical protein